MKYFFLLSLFLLFGVIYHFQSESSDNVMDVRARNIKLTRENLDQLEVLRTPRLAKNSPLKDEEEQWPKVNLDLTEDDIPHEDQHIFVMVKEIRANEESEDQMQFPEVHQTISTLEDVDLDPKVKEELLILAQEAG